MLSKGKRKVFTDSYEEETSVPLSKKWLKGDNKPKEGFKEGGGKQAKKENPVGNTKRVDVGKEKEQFISSEKKEKEPYKPKRLSIVHKDAKLKPWRLIVRNLPFKTQKEDLQNVCSKFGTFVEIVLPKCKDPKFPNSCAGFCFVQFKEKESAEKFKEHMNANKFLGRMVAVDFAIDKDTYDTAAHEEKEMLGKVKQEKPDSKPDMRQDEENDGCDNESNEEENEDECLDGSDYEDELADKKEKYLRPADKAVAEGRAVFLRNLSYETTEDAIKLEMDKFGDVKLCIICKYVDSGHSKGTAFVHFATKEEADSCIRAINTVGITIDERELSGFVAIPRENATKIEKDKLAKTPKDKRNLHLIRAGIIREGTTAANGMSDKDAQKRTRLAKTAGEKLKNLHNFVSPNRIVVHNLPLRMSDKELKDLCYRSAGRAEAWVTECRIWRDPSKTDDKNPKGKSKGFGFVAFSEHQDALTCLKKLNNDPKTFTDDRRPIVEFSIENLNALKLKENRKLKSQGKLITTKKLQENIKKQVDASKIELSKGGQKPLPSHSGPKIRHRDQKGKKGAAGKKISKAANGNRTGGSNVSLAQNSAKKKRNISGKKALTKYLALS